MNTISRPYVPNYIYLQQRQRFEICQRPGKEIRMADHFVSFLHDLRTGARSLAHAKGLTATVIVTLALGIGANAAMFSLLRGILLRPLVNRDEDLFDSRG